MHLRVALVGLPALLRDIVETALVHLDGEAVIDVVAIDRLGEPDLVTRLDELGCDAAILCVHGPDEEGRPGELLQARPGLIVLAISADGRHISVFELMPHAVPIGQLSPSELRETIVALAGKRVSGR